MNYCYELATQLGLRPVDIFEVSVEEVRLLYASSVDKTVLDVATQSEAKYWRVGDTCYLDDPEFDEPVAVDDLRYDEDGLHSIHW